MKAARMYGKHDVRIENIEKPVPGAGQMLIKMDYCGLCSADVAFYNNGKIPAKLPMVLGHENVGTVCELGEGVSGFEVGDRVLCGAPSRCAEDCPSCHRGQSNICLNAFPRTAGLGGPDGGYAEYMLIRDVAHTMIIKLPDNVDSKDAVLFDVICVALHAIRISRFRPGDSVVVSGSGSIGLAAVQFLKVFGAKKVIALCTSDEKIPLLKQYGSDHCINIKACDDLKAEILRLLDSPVGADVVFECAGNVSSMTNCIYDCVRPGGQVMLVGAVQEPFTFVPSTCTHFELDFQFSFVYLPEDVKLYLDLLSQGKISFPGLVTDIIPLDECVEKGLARHDRRNMIKILIAPWQNRE